MFGTVKGYMSMYNWTIETHQGQAGAWVGVVKHRENTVQVNFMSNWHPTAMFAFLECLQWLQLNNESVKDSEPRFVNVA